MAPVPQFDCLALTRCRTMVSDHSTLMRRVVADLEDHLKPVNCSVRLDAEPHRQLGAVAQAWKALRFGGERGRFRILYLALSRADFGWATAMLLYTRFKRAKIVVHLRDGGIDAWLAGLSPVLRRLVRWAWGRVDAFVAPSEPVRNQLEPLGGGAVARSSVIDDGTWVEATEAVPATGKTLQLLFLGDLRVESGYLDLVDAMVHLERLLPGIRVNLVMAGTVVSEDDGGEAEEGRSQAVDLEKVIRYQGLADRVTVLPPVRSLIKDALLREGKIMILPFTRTEAGSTRPAAIDALAAGLPLITTGFCSINADLEDGVNCLLIRPNAPLDIARAVVRLTDADLYARLSRNGAALAEKYSVHRHVEKLADLLAAACEPR